MRGCAWIGVLVLSVGVGGGGCRQAEKSGATNKGAPQKAAKKKGAPTSRKTGKRAPPAPQVERVTFLHFNDFHAHFRPFRWHDLQRKPHMAGGIARLCFLIKKIRRENKAQKIPTLVVVAGDVFQGTSLGSLFRGSLAIRVLNHCAIDVLALGNHEFDYGVKRLQQNLKLARFAVLSSNIYLPGGKHFVRPYLFRRMGKLRVGLFGLTTPNTPDISDKSSRKLRFAPVIPATKRILRRLRRKVDLLVGVTHIGSYLDWELARQLRGLDVLVGGHDHAWIDPPWQINKTLVVQAYQWGIHLGRHDLEINTRKKIERWRYRLLPIEPNLPQDRPVQRMVARHAQKIKPFLRQQIGVATSRFSSARPLIRLRESALANLVTDMVRESAQTDVVLLNAGGMRSDIPKGSIRINDIYGTLPFGDQIVIFRAVPGRVLRQALQRSAKIGSNIQRLKGGFLHPSGLSYTVQKGKAHDILVGGQPLQDRRLYSLATNEFLANGGDGYHMFQTLQPRVFAGTLVRDIVIEGIKKRKKISPRLDQRIKRPDLKKAPLRRR